MADAYVQLAADGSGKDVQSYENTVSGSVVEAQVVQAIDASSYTNSYVAITEGTGKKLQYYQNTIGSNDVLALAVVLVNSSGVPQ